MNEDKQKKKLVQDLQDHLDLPRDKATEEKLGRLPPYLLEDFLQSAKAGSTGFKLCAASTLLFGVKAAFSIASRNPKMAIVEAGATATFAVMTWKKFRKAREMKVFMKDALRGGPDPF